MEDKPRDSGKTPKTKETKGKSFYAAMYACLGIMLVLAVALGYYNLLTPNIADEDYENEVLVVQQQETETQQQPNQNFGQQIQGNTDFDSIPVGNMDWLGDYGYVDTADDMDDIEVWRNRENQSPNTSPTPTAAPEAGRNNENQNPETGGNQNPSASPAPRGETETEEELEESRRRQQEENPEASPSPQPEGRESENNRQQNAPTPTPGNSNQRTENEWEEQDEQQEWHSQQEWQEQGQQQHEANENQQDPFQAIAPTATFAQFNAGDNMNWPVVGEVVMDFSVDRLVFDVTLNQWRTNDNIAIAADRGTTVRAAAAGRVIETGNTRQFGQTVVIDHGNGWITTYSQLDEDVAVNVGDIVNLGQIIGTIGQPSIFSSLLGYHVGFAIHNNESPIDPGSVLMAR